MKTAIALLVLCLFLGAAPPDSPAGRAPADVLPNDNRTPGGVFAAGVLTLELDARLAAWRPDLDVDSAVTVQAFAEFGGAPRIPGPLLRAASGTTVRVRVRNSISDSTLVVHGLRAGSVTPDTIIVPPGATRAVTFTAGEPGTYLYWGTTTGKPMISERNARDSQLTGAIVIDAAGAAIDPAERIFVMTVIDIWPDSTKPAPHEDIWELAIDGGAWPQSEPLADGVGDTVRWRWLNGSYLPHPMHLHGFHFRVLAKGDGRSDHPLAAGAARTVVTEFMLPGSSFAMDWVPTRAGNWLFHCHMAPHISPYPARPDSVRGHDEHDVAAHARNGMAGLVLGIRTTSPTAVAGLAPPAPTRTLRLLAQERATPHGSVFGYTLDGDSADVRAPGPVLLLTRGETTAITVLNRTRTHTTVHWHGMELESFYDGVAGWSGRADAVAPLILPGDSFTVAFTPPRAGTYIYHTHMDESLQLPSGMYGPMIVLEPNERFDAEREVLLIIGGAVDGAPAAQAINGHRQPPPRTLAAGRTYRLRIINILPAAPVEVSLSQDSVPHTWRAVSKDGAALTAMPAGPAYIHRVGVGETYDFEWTPVRPGTTTFTARQQRDGWELRQEFVVR